MLGAENPVDVGVEILARLRIDNSSICRVVVLNTAGQELDCEEAVDTDLAYIDSRAFELVDMPSALKKEPQGWFIAEDSVIIPAEFDSTRT